MLNPPPPPHLIVFGRYPRIGVTKTRLIPVLGPAGAAAFQKKVAEKTVATARIAARRVGARLVFCHDGGSLGQMGRWLGSRDIGYRPQRPGDLGQRMYAAMKKAFDTGAGRVVLVGTDIPGLTADILCAAFDRLKTHDGVLGPSTDGGYWLVGMSRLANIFEGIAWSTATVLEKTLGLARQKRIDTCLLDPLADLDTPADLARQMGRDPLPGPYLSVIIPTLNEEGEIGRTIATAKSADAQIIVSDGGSTDRTVAMARSAGAHIVGGARGRSRQQNRGAAVAQGEVLLFLHADTRLPPDYVGHIFDSLMDRRTVLGAFRFATDLNTPAMRWIAYMANLRSHRLGLPYGDQGLFLRKTDFDAIGGFADVPIAEDLYLARRMVRRGRIVLAAAAAVTSGRRWQRLGPLRTTIINTIVTIGCLAGVSPQHLAPLYRLPPKPKPS